MAVVMTVAANPTAVSYDIVETRLEGATRVSTVRAEMAFASSNVGMQFLVSDDSIMGAQFTDAELAHQAVYPGFAIMQASLFLDRSLRRALQIGLGVGTVPTFLRQQGVATDAIELSQATVDMAAAHFGYELCTGEACPRGWTRVMDGLVFLDDDAAPTSYDVVIIDVYTGFNVLPFYTLETLGRIRNSWLHRDGVVVMNFVGYYLEPHMDIVRAIDATFRAVFKHVRLFREMPANDLHEPANLVFFASDAPITFSFPKGFENPPSGYYEALVKFQDWEMHLGPTAVDVAADGSVTTTSAEPLTKATDLRVFEASHEATVSFMAARCHELLPQRMWDELKAALAPSSATDSM
ncbi:hypothetical protein ACHHYP_20006 [Achlya hypogyna]|uniref:Spermidine synthase n=1 Tax=Achlya hypogyna TaxID=1202772 RepID=A0A1V9ZBF6_ACHHY|nr:hypothetical protein ACHHYP_20006 [Achlya hypogyna]